MRYHRRQKKWRLSVIFKMNKFIKATYAIMGATNAVFGMFIPIAVALYVITAVAMEQWQVYVVTVAAIISTLYRAIRIGYT